ncbi:MAG TPA: ATP-binding protein, partial [Lachnospiraceae bacterium]|nr:ATP-binding protein [Lachnospiraceae bacterium]
VFYISVGILFFSITTFIEANRTGRFISCSVVMSLVLNFLFLPMLFIYYGNTLCCIPVFFMIGLLYTILLLEGKSALIMTGTQALFYFLLLIFGTKIPYDSSAAEKYGLLEYADVFVAIVFAGICGGLAVRYHLILYQKEQEKSEQYHMEAMDAYIAKDIFLINMSHEIRTPMNAIVGTVDLLLDQDINERVRDSVYNILNSCNALLSITNELMDLSKSESREVAVYVARYDIGELLMEIINMISVRLMYSEVELFVEIDEKIPRYLYGDSSRLRQVFINILNNAVKYTKRGKIMLRVGYKKLTVNRISLFAEVEDTGAGIKAENIPKLFKVYQRVEEEDSEKRNVEGTGLGLSICREILDKMDGEIYVRSEYHVGSTFYFNIPQQVDAGELLADVESAELLHVLVFEKDTDARENIGKILDRLNIRADYPGNRKEFETCMMDHDYTHLFVSYDKYIENVRFLDRNLMREKLVIISEINQMLSVNKFGCILMRPVHVMNVAAVFRNENNSFVREIIKKGGFICPAATILVVDDNLTNLNVAGGLLKKYEANVITALSGRECLNILENQDVDMIFLDYMMPEMNGIDTLDNIRRMSRPRMKTLPVIALTANVVNGA